MMVQGYQLESLFAFGDTIRDHLSSGRAAPSRTMVSELLDNLLAMEMKMQNNPGKIS
jgi:hypothetical protein